MIKITIATNGEEIFDSVDIKKTTLGECSLVVFRLEQVIQELLNRDFKDKLKVSENEDGGE